MTKSLFIFVGIVMLLASPVAAIEPVGLIASYRFAVRSSGHTFQVPYDANGTLAIPSTNVKRAVLLLHGSSRSSANAYETLTEAAALASASQTTTLLLAPQFLLEVDLAFHQLPADHLFWSEAGWKEGNASQSTAAHPRPASLSSFAVMDSLLYRIGSRYPNLEAIVFAGHSAGGQFIHRFAAGSTVRDALKSTLGLDVEFVVANPSSYLYLNAERMTGSAPNQFMLPSSSVIASCPGYNDYKYGLLARNTYMSRLTSAQIVNRFPQAHVVYLLGELDTNPAADDLDTSCAANLQGSHRLERGRVFADYLRHFYGAAVAANHRSFVVPDVGHSAENMFKSPCGVVQLFGAGDCDPVAVAPEVLETGLTFHLDPNPFERQTTIAFAIPNRGQPVLLQVFDIRGRMIRTLFDGPVASDRSSVVWDGRSDAGRRVPAGVYFLRLQHGPETRSTSVTLMR